MKKTGLLVGGHADYLGQLANEIRAQDISLYMATGLNDVRRIFENAAIEIVIVDGFEERENRLAIVQDIMTISPRTSIHCLGEGMDPYWFVSRILSGLAE